MKVVSSLKIIYTLCLFYSTTDVHCIVSYKNYEQI